jgi:hypothetical protein
MKNGLFAIIWFFAIGGIAFSLGCEPDPPTPECTNLHQVTIDLDFVDSYTDIDRKPFCSDVPLSISDPCNYGSNGVTAAQMPNNPDAFVYEILIYAPCSGIDDQIYVTGQGGSGLCNYAIDLPANEQVDIEVNFYEICESCYDPGMGPFNCDYSRYQFYGSDYVSPGQTSVTVDMFFDQRSCSTSSDCF